MSDVRIEPGKRLRGVIRVPGDKSISHRLAMVAALADGRTEITNFSESADCASTLQCLKMLGVEMAVQADNRVSIVGRGLRGLLPPSKILDAGNSGSTIRMLSGLLAAHPFHSTIAGDASLSRRPMQRVMGPLSEMGARFEARDQKFPPVTIHGTDLHGISYQLPVPSAQVKTAILFAGLMAEGRTVVIEPVSTRNHTEIALHHFGAKVEVKGREVSVEGGVRLSANKFDAPGDPSAAAFWVAAALLVPESELLLPAVGLNPTRIEFFGLLQSMGAEIEFVDRREMNGEPIGNVIVRSSSLEGGEIPPTMVPSLIDEIPILAVLGARSRRGLSVRGAQELRLKESDRIAAVVSNLRAMGVDVRELEDGFEVAGSQAFHGAEIDSFGDHRIAMAFSIAALVADSPSVIHGAECVKISFPAFYETLDALHV